MNYGLVLYAQRKNMVKRKFLLFVAFLIAILLLSFIYSNASGQTLTGKVVQVKDGDTVVISPIEGGQFFICRLYGIDATETAKRGKRLGL